MPTTRTPEQKAAHAAREKARRLAKRQTANDRIERPVLSVVPEIPLPGRGGKPAAYLDAVAKKKLGKRGPGRKVSDDELAEIARRIAVDTFCTMRQAQEVAYWIEGIALTPVRWEKAWTAAETATAQAV